MLRANAPAFAIDKTGAVVSVEVSPGAPRQREIDPGRERVALVVIEEEIAFVRRLEIGKAAGDPTSAFRVLMGIRGMELGSSLAMRGEFVVRFPSADAGAIDGASGKENVELPRMSWSKKFFAPVRKLETSKVHPATGMVRPEFVLLVALTPQAAGNQTLLGRLVQ